MLFRSRSFAVREDSVLKKSENWRLNAESNIFSTFSRAPIRSESDDSRASEFRKGGTDALANGKKMCAAHSRAPIVHGRVDTEPWRNQTRNAVPFFESRRPLARPIPAPAANVASKPDGGHERARDETKGWQERKRDAEKRRAKSGRAQTRRSIRSRARNVSTRLPFRPVLFEIGRAHV